MVVAKRKCGKILTGTPSDPDIGAVWGTVLHNGYVISGPGKFKQPGFGVRYTVLKQGAVNMKRIALLTLFVLALASSAFAQTTGLVGDISAYADDQGNVCNLNSPGGGALVTVYIVHKFSDGGGATGSRFKATFPAGLSFLAFTTAFVPIGNLSTDLSLGYGACLSSTTSLGSALLSSTSPSPTCSYFSIVAADNFPDPIATDCSFGEFTVKTGQGIVNPDGTCQCNIATEATSWGKVKALYR
jgi:hypothetical protein